MYRLFMMLINRLTIIAPDFPIVNWLNNIINPVRSLPTTDPVSPPPPTPPSALDDAPLTHESNALAEGGSAFVYKGRWKGNVVAIKMFKSDEPGKKSIDKSFKVERQILGKIRAHENIISLHGSYHAPAPGSNHMMIFEYMPSGDVSQYLCEHRRKTATDAGIRDKIALQTGKAMAYLWSLRIIHRDFKGENILLDADQNAKISDFGFAVEARADTLTYTSLKNVGSVGWMPPEAFPDDEDGVIVYTETYDIHAYGTLLWMLASYEEYEPYPTFEEDEAITANARNIPQKFCKTTSDACKELIVRCWDKDPKKRPSATEIVEQLTNGLPLMRRI